MAVTIFLLKDPLWLGRYKYTWALLGMLLIGVTLILGKGSTPGGPRLWLDLGPVSFQPSEVLKVLLVIFFAGYLSEYQEILSLGRYRIGPISLPPFPHLIPLLVMWGLSLMLLIGQRDLGAAFLFFGIFLVMLYIASGKGLYIWAGGIAFVAGAAVAYRFIDVVQQRFGVWLDPWSRASGDAYQAIQGLMAFSAGGLLGSGLGYGQSQYIPAVHTDFIFAAIGEEMGILGALAILALYLLLAYRGYRIALIATNPFNQLLAAGLTSVLALQSLVIVAGNLKFIPLTGVTLPFISYGGSSLVTNFIIIGLLLRLSGPKRRASQPAWPRRGSGKR